MSISSNSETLCLRKRFKKELVNGYPPSCADRQAQTRQVSRQASGRLSAAASEMHQRMPLESSATENLILLARGWTLRSDRDGDRLTSKVSTFVAAKVGFATGKSQRFVGWFVVWNNRSQSEG